MVLRKQDVLIGIDEAVEVELQTVDGSLYLRPLSSKELNNVLNIEAEGFGNFEATAKQGKKDPGATGKINLAKMNRATQKAQYEAIFLSINNPRNEDKWTLDDIESLKKNIVEELYDKIMELSGAGTTVNDVKRFPQNK